MPLVIVLSSHVAASRVGGGLAPYVLAPLAIDPIVVPTVVLGRHPGWGPPGGGTVSDAMFASQLDTLVAQGLHRLADAILTGYFASPGQVASARAFISTTRAAPREGISGALSVVVDPILGDWPNGGYLRSDVAGALCTELVPEADLLTPNLYELGVLSGREIAADAPPEVVLAAARALRASLALGGIRSRAPGVLVTSVRVPPDRIGALQVDDTGASLALTPELSGPQPRGTGDLLALSRVGWALKGLSARQALQAAVGTVGMVLEAAQRWSAPELPVAALHAQMAQPPWARTEDLAPK
jgi:pyridoxine kinase